MGKSTYKVKETKESYKFSYTGNLAEALEKARNDLDNERGNTEIQYWEWIKKKADAAIMAHRRKKARIEAFIKAATRQLESEATNE